MNTSPLVVTHYVYAKSRDGAFYPGRIIGKESENSYNIEFSDLRSSTVNENDLVWLGFYRLPPDCWPKSPVILPVKSTRDDTESYSGRANGKKVDGFSSRGPESLRILKNAASIYENSQCMNERMASFVSSVPHIDGQRQMRSSVIRLNRKALSKEIFQNHVEDSTSTPTRLDTGTVDDRWWKYSERKEHHFSNSSLCSMSPHPSYDRHDPPHSNTPCLTPPSTPGSLPPPLFVCKQYDTVDFGEMWSHMDTRDIGGGKRRRRDNMKKCRKVYGIDNRDLWCTQCKWKKACSRFQIRNYNERYF